MGVCELSRWFGGVAFELLCMLSLSCLRRFVGFGFLLLKPVWFADGCRSLISAFACRLKTSRGQVELRGHL